MSSKLSREEILQGALENQNTVRQTNLGALEQLDVDMNSTEMIERYGRAPSAQPVFDNHQAASNQAFDIVNNSTAAGGRMVDEAVGNFPGVDSGTRQTITGVTPNSDGFSNAQRGAQGASRAPVGDTSAAGVVQGVIATEGYHRVVRETNELLAANGHEELSTHELAVLATGAGSPSYIGGDDGPYSHEVAQELYQLEQANGVSRIEAQEQMLGLNSASLENSPLVSTGEQANEVIVDNQGNVTLADLGVNTPESNGEYNGPISNDSSGTGVSSQASQSNQHIAVENSEINISDNHQIAAEEQAARFANGDGYGGYFGFVDADNSRLVNCHYCISVF